MSDQEPTSSSPRPPGAPPPPLSVAYDAGQDPIPYEIGVDFRHSRAKPLRPPPPARNPWLWFLTTGMWTMLGLVVFGLLTLALTFGPPVVTRTRWSMWTGTVTRREVVITPAPVIALILLAAIAG